MKKTLTILAVLCSAALNAQSAGDPKFFVKASGAGDVTSYVSKVSGGFFWLNGIGTPALFTTNAYGRGLLALADAATIRSYIGAGTSSFSGAFTDLTGKPTTIAGYGITDFNTLGNAQWRQLSVPLVSADISDASTGGNGTLDAGKLVLFGPEGSLTATTNSLFLPAILATSNSSSSAAAFYNSSSGSGISISVASGNAAFGTNSSTSEPTIHFQNTDATKAGPLLWIHNVDDQGAQFSNDGGIAWTSPTGAATTRTGLHLGTIATHDDDEFALLVHTHGAGDITSGTMATARLGSGTANSGTYLRGDQSWQTLNATAVGLGNVENAAASTLYAPLARTISTTSPLSGGGDLSANRTLSIANTRADGATLGAAGFIAADFNDASGIISLDYTNGQAASASANGYLTSSDWSTFNGKQSAITFGTSVQSALANNIGSAGAVVLLNGAGGTPSSITLTNATGTATSLNIGGSAASLTTGRTIQTDLASTSSASFNGTANITPGVTGILASGNGGTGNGFTKFSGPTTAEKTFTLPNASATVLTDNAAVTVAQGGTGASTAATAFSNIKQAATTSATGVVELATDGENAASVVVQGNDSRINRNQVSLLGSDFTTSSATAVDITGYTLTLTDPGTYNVLINAFYQTPNTATGAAVTMTITGSPSLRSFGRKQFTAATTTIDDMINTDDAGTVPTTMGGINVPRNVIIAGTVKTNGSNCVIQLRAVRGGTSNTITVLTGSNMTAQKISP